MKMHAGRSFLLTLVGALIAAHPATAHAAGSSGARPVPAAALSYDLTEVVPGVFVAIARGVPYYVSNSVAIVGDDAVLLVDSGAGPSEAAALREAILTVTDKPVRFLVDTHFHFDHALGHAAFPEAVTIGHEATRAGLLLGLEQPTLAGNLGAMPARIEELRGQARAEADPGQQAKLDHDAEALDAYRRELETLSPSPSVLTVTAELTVWLGDREVRILHLGRGHTAGDTVVYLPQDRLICTGDLYNGYLGFMGDAYVDEWADTLGRLANLDFETVIAGHGKPFRGKEAIAPIQTCMRDLWRQAAQLKSAGLSPEEAAQRIDLTAHAARFPRLAKPGYDPLAVRRIYTVIDERQSTPSAE